MTTKPERVTRNPDVGGRLRMLRQRSGLSIRQLGEMADVTPGMISRIERDTSSPSIGLLHKLLQAMGSDLGAFFANGESHEAGPVHRREHMRVVSDGERQYTLVLPRRDNIAVQLLDEMIRPHDERPPFETLASDIAGYVLSGELTLEIDGSQPELLRTGDGFHVPRGTRHRGFAAGDDPVRLVTVAHPPSY
jgi:transcriptional regulator with XRE-family HTH domain